MMRMLFTVGTLVFGLGAVYAVAPAVNKVNFSTHLAVRNIGFLDAGESVVMTATVKPNAKTDQIVHTLKFRPRGVEALTVHAVWHVHSADSPVRLTEVNIDLLDASGALVTSDMFTGILSGMATSDLTVDGLEPNQVYRLVVTGTRSSTAAYSIVIE